LLVGTISDNLGHANREATLRLGLQYDGVGLSLTHLRPPWSLLRSPHLLEQRLARPDDREGDRLIRYVDAAVALAGDRAGGCGEIALGREVLTVVGTAGVLALQSRLRDHLGNGDLAVEIQPVVPSQVESAIAILQACGLKL